MFDDIMDLLDSPRQAITNLARGAFGDDIDPLGMLPGGLGLLGSMALGATGVGLPLAILGGSLMGGGAQFGGNLSGNSAFKAPTSEDVARGMFGSDDFLPTLLAGALTDPLSYVGGIGGARAGAKIGRGLEDAARMAGPGYRGHGTLMEAVERADKWVANHWAYDGKDDLFRSQIDAIGPAQLERLASEIPPGSTFLGNGVEGIALKTPQGDVLRFGFTEAPMGRGRPVSEFVNPTTRAVDIPNQFGMKLRVERSPFAGKPSFGGMPKFVEDAWGGGIDFFDAAERNLGSVMGRDVIIDPGALETTARFTGSYHPVSVFDEKQTPGTLARLLGQPRLRKAIEAGSGTDNLGIEQLLSRMGAGLGTGSVAASRSI